MIWIKDIIEVTPFRIKLLFDNGEVREVLFEEIFAIEKKNNPESIFLLLNNPEVFQQVKLNPGETIYWDNIVYFIDYDGQRKLGPLDISPEYLYEMSVPVSSEKILH